MLINRIVSSKITLLLALLIAAATFEAYAFDDHDFQVWDTDTQEFKPAKNLKGIFEQEFRWANNASQFFYQHYDLGLFYAFNNFLSAGGGYRYILEKKTGEFKIENQPYLCAFLNLGKGGFNLENRNRLEYRIYEGSQNDSWRYRNRFTLKPPWKFTILKIQPMVGDEIFIGFGGVTCQFNENRFFSGFGMELAKNIKAEMLYLLQSKKSAGAWIDANVFWLKLKVAL